MNALKRVMNAIAVELRGMPLIVRLVTVGAASASVIGGLVGLVVGLFAYPPTAWFAVVELGVPAGVVGGIVGLIGALILTAGRRITRRITPSG
jgi:membrane associated rhomboid family serine protease